MGKRSFESFDWECEEKQVGMGGCIEWMLRTYLDIRSQVGHFMIYECHNIGEADSCGTMLTWIARNFLALISGKMLLCWVRFWCLDSLVLPCIFDISILHTWPLTWSTILDYLLGEMLLVLSHGEKKLYTSGILVFFFF